MRSSLASTGVEEKEDEECEGENDEAQEGGGEDMEEEIQETDPLVNVDNAETLPEEIPAAQRSPPPEEEVPSDPEEKRADGQGETKGTFKAR